MLLCLICVAWIGGLLKRFNETFDCAYTGIGRRGHTFLPRFHIGDIESMCCRYVRVGENGRGYIGERFSF